VAEVEVVVGDVSEVAVEADGAAVELWVAVEAQDTAEGRLVTPFVLHRV